MFAAEFETVIAAPGALDAGAGEVLHSALGLCYEVLRGVAEHGRPPFRIADARVRDGRVLLRTRWLTRPVVAAAGSALAPGRDVRWGGPARIASSRVLGTWNGEAAPAPSRLEVELVTPAILREGAPTPLGMWESAFRHALVLGETLEDESEAMRRVRVAEMHVTLAAREMGLRGKRLWLEGHVGRMTWLVPDEARDAVGRALAAMRWFGVGKQVAWGFGAVRAARAAGMRAAPVARVS